MKVGLVLGGGGARCLAHIGVYRALEEEGVIVDGVAGCSTGALVGALVAAGHSAGAIKEVFDQDMLTLLSPSKDAGLLDQEKIGEVLRRHLPAAFGELELPFAAVATDIQSGRLVTLNRGKLVESVLASNAFPGVFDAVTLDGYHLIDGGVLDNVPVDAVTTLTHSPVLAVDVSPSKTRELELEQNRGLLRRITGQFTLPVDMLRKAYIISQSFIIDMRLSMHPPELLLRPEFPDDLGVTDFGRLEDAVEIGYRATREALERDGDKLRRAGLPDEAR